MSFAEPIEFILIGSDIGLRNLFVYFNYYWVFLNIRFICYFQNQFGIKFFFRIDFPPLSFLKLIFRLHIFILFIFIRRGRMLAPNLKPFVSTCHARAEGRVSHNFTAREKSGSSSYRASDSFSSANSQIKSDGEEDSIGFLQSLRPSSFCLRFPKKENLWHPLNNHQGKSLPFN